MLGGMDLSVYSLDEPLPDVVPELQRRKLFRTEYEGGPCARI
jgi:hypothetical protein